jgi:hypothetical protein
MLFPASYARFMERRRIWEVRAIWLVIIAVVSLIAHFLSGRRAGLDSNAMTDPGTRVAVVFL